MDRKQPNAKEGSGRKPNQRIKSYLVLQYLLKNSDEEHPAKAVDIVAYLEDEIGIAAERRSLYKDIQEINLAEYALRVSCDLDEARENLENDPSLALIQNKHSRGFYVSSHNRSIRPDEARLLAECVYMARFIPNREKQLYIDIVCGGLSESQREQIEHSVIVSDSGGTINRETIKNIDKIKDTLPPNEARRIKFQYLKYTIQKLGELTERRNGQYYEVSPLAMMIDNGNYYLLAVDERAKMPGTHLTHYRIDRMRNVKILQTKGRTAEEMEGLDLREYTKRVFSMFSGRRERVTIRFVASLLDTVVDRFGIGNLQYINTDSRHFTVSLIVEVSNQFFGWLCGFGNRAVITSPPDVVEEFRAFLGKIREKYES